MIGDVEECVDTCTICSVPCIRPLVIDNLQCPTLKRPSYHRVCLWTWHRLPNTAFLQLDIGPAVSVDGVFGSEVPQMNSSLHCAGHKALIHVQGEAGNASWQFSAPEAAFRLSQVKHPDIPIGKPTYHHLTIITASNRPAIVLFVCSLLSLNTCHTSCKLSLVPHSYLYQRLSCWVEG